jgi:hypothetical protein
MKPAEQKTSEPPKGRKRRNNRMVEYQGQQMCVTEFAERIGQRPALVFKRLYAGWTVTQIVAAPDPAR